MVARPAHRSEAAGRTGSEGGAGLNGRLLMGVLSLTKSGDALLNMRIVIIWLLATLNAPAAVIGLVVPVREALSMLPQVVLSGPVARLGRVKGLWIAGSAVQAICAGGIAGVALFASGALAGWLILALVACFSLGRCLASLTLKDIQGRVVSKGERGRISGPPAAIAGTAGFLLGALFILSGDVRSLIWIAGVILVAAGCWGLSIIAMGLVREPEREKGGPEKPGADQKGTSRVEGESSQQADHLSTFSLLRNTPGFVQFLAARILLVATAVLPPFVILLAREQGVGAIGDLGWMIAASGAGAAASGVVWGRFADRNSAHVMAIGGAIVCCSIISLMISIQSGLAAGSQIVPYAFVLFVISIGYAGVRLGRKTFIVDMTTDENRPRYVGLANTITGAFVLLSGAAGLFAEWAGVRMTLMALTVLCAAGVAVSLVLPNPASDEIEAKAA